MCDINEGNVSSLIIGGLVKMLIILTVESAPNLFSAEAPTLAPMGRLYSLYLLSRGPTCTSKGRAEEERREKRGREGGEEEREGPVPLCKFLDSPL